MHSCGCTVHARRSSPHCLSSPCMVLTFWRLRHSSWSLLPADAFARAAYPTTSPVSLLPGSRLPAPASKPAYPVPHPPLFFLVTCTCAQAAYSTIALETCDDCQSPRPLVLIIVYNISKYSTLYCIYVVPFLLIIICRSH